MTMTYRNLALVRAFSARMKCIGWILAMWCLGPIVAAYAQEDRGEIRVPPPRQFFDRQINSRGDRRAE